MARTEHIISRPGAAVGDEAISICGKEFKVKWMWDDIPEKIRICRDCIEVAVGVMQEADEMILEARQLTSLLLQDATVLGDMLMPDRFALDVIHEFTQKHADEQSEKQAAKELEEKRQVTCTCTWTSPEVRAHNPECPVHHAWTIPESEDVEIVTPPVAPDATTEQASKEEAEEFVRNFVQKEEESDE